MAWKGLSPSCGRLRTQEDWTRLPRPPTAAMRPSGVLAHRRQAGTGGDFATEPSSESRRQRMRQSRECFDLDECALALQPGLPARLPLDQLRRQQELRRQFFLAPDDLQGRFKSETPHLVQGLTDGRSEEHTSELQSQSN